MVAVCQLQRRLILETREFNPYQAPRTPGGQRRWLPGEKLTLAEIWFSFAGRLPRQPYWLLASLPLWVSSMVVQGILAATHSESFGVMVSILTVWPSCAISVKRLHDRGKSGWWLLFALIPIVGVLWLSIEMGFFRGTDGENRFGGDATDLY